MRSLIVLAAAAGVLAATAGPAAAASIKTADVVDTFSCDGRPYGYYGDADKGFQVFHVCLPTQFPDGTEKAYKWTFICPQETTFNENTFTCSRGDTLMETPTV